MSQRMIVQLTEADLETIIRRAVEIGVVAALDAKEKEPKKSMLTKRETCLELGISATTVGVMARSGKLEKFYVGKSLRFDREQVLSLKKSIYQGVKVGRNRAA